MRCREHGGLCAYTGEEADRCPWCHATWGVILRTGYHSCEVSKTWSHNGRERAREARRTRARAARRLGVALTPTGTTEGA